MAAHEAGGGSLRRKRSNLGRLAAVLNPRAVHGLRDLRLAGVDPAAFEEYRAARWRERNGLEARALVALCHAPEVLPEARRQVSPADFLTPPYAALAAVLLEAEPGAPELERARAAIAGRAYLPAPEGFAWADEARQLVGKLAERRERWVSEQLARKRRAPALEDRAGTANAGGADR